VSGACAGNVRPTRANRVGVTSSVGADIASELTLPAPEAAVADVDREYYDQPPVDRRPVDIDFGDVDARDGVQPTTSTAIVKRRGVGT
jgi:hypothetical protein